MCRRPLWKLRRWLILSCWGFIDFVETFGVWFLRTSFPPYHLDWLEPHPPVLRTVTFPDREGYNIVEVVYKTLSQTL
jgi:hypothetical protein